MSYTPTNWKDGDLVTSAKLNKIEQGIAAGGGILIVHEDENGTLDKTWQEIHDADICYYIIRDDYTSFSYPIFGTGIEEGHYVISIKTISDDLTAIAESPNDYPIINSDNK